MALDSPFSHSVTWVALLSFFGSGIMMSLIGAIKLKLAQKLVLTDSDVGKLISALLFAGLLTYLVAGPFLDAFGHRTTILIGFVVTCLGIALIGKASVYASAVLGCVVLGAGGSVLSTGGYTLIVPAINPHNPAAANNLGTVFFGLGAFLMPLMIGLVLKKLPLGRGLMLISLVLVLAVVPTLTATYPNLDTSFQLAQSLFLLTDKIVWIAGLALLFYVGIEVSMASWITTYFKSIRFSDEKASAVLSSFWVAMLVGRLAASQVVQKGAEAPLVLFAAAIAGGAIYTMIRTNHHGVATIAVLVAGLCFGPLFPTIVGLAFSKFPPAQHGSVFGAISAMGFLGGTTIPALIGMFSQGKSIRQSLYLAVGASVLLAIFGVVLGGI
jgi:fucose permease